MRYKNRKNQGRKTGNERNVMNIAEAKTQVKDTIEAYLTKDGSGMHVIAPAHQRPVFLLGAPGIGKTAIMEQIARELGIGLVSYSMTHHTRQSALGLPFITHHDFEGFSYDASEYTMSEIIASVYDYMAATGLRRGILFLDEINCVSETLYPSMLQFLQFKTFGQHRVPEDWVVVCAGNPPEYNKSVHEFDIVTLDRLRKVEVEPDYAAWKAYAQESGVHPAITTFLEVKKDCFYSVEAKPGGRSFVTARGWNDLSETISLFEQLEKPVNAQLISQFLQDDVIAERFALYYDLFNKYRADYRIDSILAGAATEDLYARAAAAAFDERVALLGLLLDALCANMGEAAQKERVLMEVRDALREAKPRLLGESGHEPLPTLALDILDDMLATREGLLARAREAGTAPRARLHIARQALAMLKRFRAACEQERAVEGAQAFALASALFQEETSQLEPLADLVEQKLAHVFDFIERSFGDGREMLVFVSELTARKPSSRFISTFGSPSYYAHSEHLMVDDHRQALLARIDELQLEG